MFAKIDYDHSGKIDMNELRHMFEQNGIILSPEEIQSFFSVTKTKSKGVLTIEEFKQLYQNPATDTLFRMYIKRARA